MSLVAQHTLSKKTEMPAIQRYKIRFRDPAALRAAQAIEAPMSEVRVVNQKRQFLGVRLPPAARASAAALRAFEAQLRSYEEIYGGEIVEDFQYSMEAEVFDPETFRPGRPQDPSLDDVLQMIRAREAWGAESGLRCDDRRRGHRH